METKFIAVLLMAAPLALGQGPGESALRQYFEGMSVELKMDMPGTSAGVDVYPTAAMPVDFRKVADRLKTQGVGVHQGQTIMITKVIVKKDHIEVQLGGGGFGTFTDRLAVAGSTPMTVYQGRSRREKDLEEDLKYSWGRDSRGIREELDDLKRERRRDNNMNQALNAQARQVQQENIRAMKAQGGSRFNLWYKDGFTSDATTPDGVMAALSKYVNFSQAGGMGSEPLSASNPSPASDPEPSAASAPSGGLKALKKGMTVSQVEQLLGPANTANAQKQGGLDITVREYNSDGLRVSAQFVGGVLVDFTISPA